MGVDWLATGQMLSGIGTLAGAAAVAYAAHKGANTFALWKKQKTEERKIDAAEEIITETYNVEIAIKNMRSPFSSAQEIERADTDLKDIFVRFDTISSQKKQMLQTSQVIINRANSHAELWDRFFSLMPTAKALFGAELWQALRDLWRRVHEVRIAAQHYSKLDDSAGDAARAFEMKFWEGADPIGVDEVAVGVDQAIVEIEQCLLPVIRS